MNEGMLTHVAWWEYLLYFLLIVGVGGLVRACTLVTQDDVEQHEDCYQVEYGTLCDPVGTLP